MNSQIIKNEIVIDWGRAFTAILKKWWIVLLSIIIGTTLGLGLGIKADVPVYECQAVYVLSYSGGDSIGSMSSEYSFLSRILYNCIEVLNQNTFTQKIADEINAGIAEDSEEYIPIEVLQRCITYDYSSKGTLIYITVDTGDPVLSFNIMTSVTNNLQEHIKSQYQLAGIDSMVFSLINTPEMPEEPVESTTRFMFTVIGMLAVTLITIAVIVLHALTDTRIKKEDDLKNRFNAPVLGIIPNFNDSKLYGGGYYKYGADNK